MQADKIIQRNIQTQNLTRKKADEGPLSKRSFKPPLLLGNLSDICPISTD